MSEDSSFDVAIVGAGFSGTALAVRLLRRNPGLRLLLVEKRKTAGQGVAYGTASPQHVLNVPAGRMSVFVEDADDFLRYAAARDSTVRSSSFLRRRLYGEYLGQRLREALGAAHQAQHLEAEVVALEGDRLCLRDGRRFQADRVVIASGNFPPGDPPAVEDGFAVSPAYIRDPWAPGALDAIPVDRPVLLIGTGLTMVDMALELARRGRAAPLIAISRRGLLPRDHRHHVGPALEPAVVMDLLRAGEPTLRRYLRVLRLCIAELGERGVDWRDVITALRPVTAELWRSLDTTQRRRFLRHLQPWWDVHRHRVAPDVAEQLRQLRESGRLSVEAGRLLRVGATTDGAEVEWRKRRGGCHAMQVGSVINCTGPHTRLAQSDDPLTLHLLAEGRMRPDPLGLGVETDSDGALLDAAGSPAENLFYIGPLLRARDWECTAVPELRQQADRLATHLLEKFDASSATRNTEMGLEMEGG